MTIFDQNIPKKFKSCLLSYGQILASYRQIIHDKIRYKYSRVYMYTGSFSQYYHFQLIFFSTVDISKGNI